MVAQSGGSKIFCPEKVFCQVAKFGVRGVGILIGETKGRGSEFGGNRTPQNGIFSRKSGKFEKLELVRPVMEDQFLRLGSGFRRDFRIFAEKNFCKLGEHADFGNALAGDPLAAP